MKYMAAVLLLVAAMSAQNAPSTSKADDNTGIEGLPKGAVAGPPLKGQHPGHLDIPAISREANGSLVSIIMFAGNGDVIAKGSGFFVSEDGRVVTNYHVIETGSYAFVEFPNGDYLGVDIMGVLASDKDRDVAIIKADGKDVWWAPDHDYSKGTIKAHGFHFRPLPLGDSDRLQVGEEVVAIGNPLSLEQTVSNGIVSAIRTTEVQGGKFVQITAPISPGSSGGPLFNMAGEVVGITTSRMKEGQNLNFAIPINDVKPLLRASLSSKPSFLPGYGKSVTPEPTEATSGPSLEETLQWIKTTSAVGIKGVFAPPKEGFTFQSVMYISPVGKPACPGYVKETLYTGREPWIYAFSLSDVDPDSIYQEDGQIKFEMTDQQKKIEAWVNRDEDVDPMSDVEPDSYLESGYFHVSDDSYRRLLMKAFKHAVILCGGKTSTF
jgi:S1-C subfamily serine protease